MRTMRALRFSLGYVWAAALLLFGLWVWQHRAGLSTGVQGWAGVDHASIDAVIRCVAVFGVSGGFFVFMVFIADEVCPKTPLLVGGALRFFAGAMAMGALALSGWLAYRFGVEVQ